MTLRARAGLASKRAETTPARVFAYSPQDLGLVLLAPISVGLLAASAPLALSAGAPGLAAWASCYALWVWWGSNTIAHNHLHNPVFRSRIANRGLALFLTAALSIPQTLWRNRHLAHHAESVAKLGGRTRHRGKRLRTSLAASRPRVACAAHTSAPPCALGCATTSEALARPPQRLDGVVPGGESCSCGLDGRRAHRAGRTPRLRLGRRLLSEFALVFACFGLLAWLAPLFLVAALLPGLAAGLGLCALQGRYEHRLSGRDYSDGVSTYGRLHNAVWFNDGHHAEHHRWPRRHWSKLPAGRLDAAPVSARAPMLRIVLDEPGRTRGRVLAWLERLALRSPRVQRFLIKTHARALGRLLPRATPVPPQRVLIVGGGLFPRTALALAALLPDATFELLDADPTHLTGARAHLAARGLVEPRVRFRHGVWQPGEAQVSEAESDHADLIVVPLAFEGDREALFQPGPVLRLVHAFPWDRQARGLPAEPISKLLLGKRLVAVAATP